MGGWRWVAGLAVAAVLGGLGVDRWGAGSGNTLAANGVHQPAQAASATWPGPASTPRSSTLALPGASAPEPAPTQQRPFDELPAEGVQICGGGRATADDVRRWQADPDAGRAWLTQEEALLMQRASVSLTRMASRLAAGNAAQQVAARLLVGDVDGAAALAAPSTDPRAYQMALTACAGGRGGEAPACRRLSARQWAALDPTDARPWLRLLDEAQARGDAAAVDAALAEVATRRRLSPGTFLLESQLVGVADVEPDPALLSRVLITAIGTDLAMPSAAVIGLMKACLKEPDAAARRLPLCRQSAKQLLAVAPDLLEAWGAQRLADRVGVPKSSQAYSEATLRAAQMASDDHALAAIGLDCDAMKRMSQISVRRAALGELGMALEILKQRSPHGPAASGAL